MGKKLARKLRIPSYRKHHSGQARVTIAGRDYYLGPYDSEQSKTAYQRLISEYLATNGAMQPTAGHDELTIVEMLDQFVSYANLYYGHESTELSDLKRIMRRLNKSYADLPASKFAFVQFEAILTRYLLRPESQHCFRPVENESREDDTGKRKRLPKANEFGRRAGDYFDSNTYARAIRQACDIAFPAPDGTKGKALEQWRKEHRWFPNSGYMRTPVTCRKSPCMTPRGDAIGGLPSMQAGQSSIAAPRGPA